MTIQTSGGPEWLSPTEFLALHEGKFGRNSLYNWLAQKKIPHVSINRKIFIPADAFSRMLSEQSNES
jgi:hypothetical protein